MKAHRSTPTRTPTPSPQREAEQPARDSAQSERALDPQRGHRFEKMPLAADAGRVLPRHVLHKMETVFNADFSDVRVYENAEVSSVGAIAYAQGSQVYFAPGMYRPNSSVGQQIIGHELAHIMQQRAGRVSAPPMQDGQFRVMVDEQLEREADRLGRNAAQGRANSDANQGAPQAAEGDRGSLPKSQTTPRAESAPVIQPMLRASRMGSSLFHGQSRRPFSSSSGGGGGGDDQRRLQRALEEMKKAEREGDDQRRLQRALEEMKKAEREKEPPRDFTDFRDYDPKKDRPKNNMLFRAEDFAFLSKQPKFGTAKAHINKEGELEPMKLNGKTTPALHVHGKPEDKKESPYSSTSPVLSKVTPYGKNLLEISLDDLNSEQIVTQEAIQKDIRDSKDPRFDETARNVTQPGKPLWRPEASQSEALRRLGINPGKPEFNYRDRAAVNSDRDEEVLVHGKARVKRYWHSVMLHPGVNWEKIGLIQGRDTRSLHPGGYRVPFDPKVAQQHFEARQKEQEEARERQYDEEYGQAFPYLTRAEDERARNEEWDTLRDLPFFNRRVPSVVTPQQRALTVVQPQQRALTVRENNNPHGPDAVERIRARLRKKLQDRQNQGEGK